MYTWTRAGHLRSSWTGHSVSPFTCCGHKVKVQQWVASCAAANGGSEQNQIQQNFYKQQRCQSRIGGRGHCLLFELQLYWSSCWCRQRVHSHGIGRFVIKPCFSFKRNTAFFFFFFASAVLFARYILKADWIVFVWMLGWSCWGGAIPDNWWPKLAV